MGIFDAIDEPGGRYGGFATHATSAFVASHCTAKWEMEDRAAVAGEKFGILRNLFLTPIDVRL